MRHVYKSLAGILLNILCVAASQTNECNPPLVECALKSMPKIELHAHLHGCIRKSTLMDLIAENGVQNDYCNELHSENNLSKCVMIFHLIHHAVVRKANAERILRETLEDFMAENVIYLELRTTPRALSDCSMEEYIQSLVSIIDEHNKRYGDRMQVRLILSINRSKSLQDAYEVVSLATKFLNQSKVIVGIDFSGNPLAGSFFQFKPVLDLARRNKLKLSVHCSEIPDIHFEASTSSTKESYSETDAIISYR